MKNSGIEWIGMIPEEWELRKVKNVANIYVGNSIKDNEKDNYSDSIDANPYIATKDINALTSKINYENGMYTKIDDNSFKIAKKYSTLMCIEGGSAGKKIALLDRDVSFVNKLCCFSPQNINSYFLYYFLQSPTFNAEFNLHISGLIGGVSQGEIKEFSIVIPDLKQQQKIADFLDEKVTEIDAAIEKTKSTIEDYKKYKQSVITEAVTKGLNPDVEMKVTNNIHIPEIPSDWEMKKMKYIFYIKKDIAGEDGYDILSITQRGIKIKDISRNEGQLAADYSKYQLVEVGDFAMNHMDLLTGWVDVSKYSGVTSPDYRVFNFINSEDYSRDYYLYMMQMCYTNRIFYGLGQGVSNLGRWRLQSDKFLNFIVPVPALEEQKKIVAYLDSRCTEIDNLIASKEAIIEELQTYKKSLIYEYVTGKKEVE